MVDSLGDRMKSQYEDRTRHKLPRRTYTIIRIDGKAFHSWTKGFARPFAEDLMDVFDLTTIELCKGIESTVCAFTQSDEISLLLCDFNTPQTQAWFDGNIQKITSVAASMCTAHFNHIWQGHPNSLDNRQGGIAFFDARVFTIPDPTEVYNYFVWRQQDATRNAISMAAQAAFSHKLLHGLSSGQMQDKLFTEAGINFNDYPVDCRRGRFFYKAHRTSTERIHRVDKYGKYQTITTEQRKLWVQAKDLPIFTQDPEFLVSKIPVYT